MKSRREGEGDSGIPQGVCRATVNAADRACASIGRRSHNSRWQKAGGACKNRNPL